MYPLGPTEAGPAFVLVLSSQSSGFLEQTMSQNLCALLGTQLYDDVAKIPVGAIPIE